MGKSCFSIPFSFFGTKIKFPISSIRFLASENVRDREEAN